MSDPTHGEIDAAVADARRRLLEAPVSHESMVSGHALVAILVGGTLAAVPFVVVQTLLFPNFPPVGFALGPLSIVALNRYEAHQKHKAWRAYIRTASAADIKSEYRQHFRRSHSVALWDALYD